MILFPNTLQADFARRMRKYQDRSRLWRWRYFLGHPQYRTLLWHRLRVANRGAFGLLCERMYQRSIHRSGLEILTPVLGGGAIFPHWGRIILNAEAIGRDLYCLHQVTLANDYKTGRPTLGDDVFLGVGATVLGRVHIGNQVLVAAGSVVLDDVPDYSLVAGNPARVRRALEPGEIRRMIGY